MVVYDALLQKLFSRFLTQLWGQPGVLVFIRNLQLRLSIEELAFLFVQNHRIFARMPASLYTVRQVQNYVWRYGAVALFLAVSLRDPTLLVSWMQSRIRKITLFQHQRFFRTLALTLKAAVLAPMGRYRLQGVRVQVTGKISVTGNAMSRTYLMRVGQQGNSSLCERVAQCFTIVRTRTGCLGVWLGFFF